MMRPLWVFTLCLMALSPVQAKDLEIDAGAAYVVIEVQHLEDAVLKGTKVPGVVTLARYDPAKGDVRGGDLSRDTRLPEGESVRVTLQGKPVAKTKTSRLYVVKLEPDTWVVEGANGTAFSLGSMVFTMVPGQVLDLGVFKPAVDWLEDEGPKGMGAGLIGAALFGSMKPKETRPIRIDWHARASSDIALPQMLSSRSVATVEFEPNHKFGNYLGGLVNRFGGRAARPGAELSVGAKAQGAEGNDD